MPESNLLEAPSAVAEATVYRSQAVITRTATLTLEPGRQTVYIDQLPEHNDSDTVRVSGSGTAQLSIEDFRVAPRIYSEIPAERLQALVDGKKELEKEMKSLEDQVAIIHQQKDFLQQISSQTTTSIGQEIERQDPDPAAWRKVLAFLGEEGNKYNEAQRKLEERVAKIEEEIAEIEHHLKRNQKAGSRTRTQVQVRIDCEEGGEFTFRVTYLSRNVNWFPSYDARVDTTAKSIVLRYYGTLRQKTGEDWKDVKVRFSTARPRISGNPPELHQWTVRERVHVTRSFVASEMEMAPQKEMMEEASLRKRKKSAVGGQASPAPAGAPMQGAEVESGQGATVVFTPAGSSDVPGDGSDQKLLIMEEEFPNEFRYLSIPRLAPYVYLTSEIANQTDFPLLPGQINIFINGDFVGRAKIKELVATGEKFDLNLGVDEAIKVKHELKRRSGDEKGLFNRQRVIQFFYTITLDNQHDREETILVRDHLPVSEEERIKVKLNSLMPEENPEKDEDELPNGALEWKLQVGGREKSQIEYSFSVSHDPGVELSGL